MTRTVIVFDVETIPDPRITHDEEVKRMFLETVKVGNRGAESAEQYRMAKLEDWRTSRAAVDHWAAQIVAIGWSELDSNKTHAVVGYKAEGTVLSWFMRAMRKYDDVVLAGFNTRKFDVPLVTMRCGIRGIRRPSWWPKTGSAAWKQADLFDLFPNQKLSELAAAHRLPQKLATGADVVNMTPQMCRKYVKRDVHIERALVRLYRREFDAIPSLEPRPVTQT